MLRFPQVVRLTDKEKRGTKIRGNIKWFSGLDNDRHYCVGHRKLITFGCKLQVINLLLVKEKF